MRIVLMFGLVSCVGAGCGGASPTADSGIPNVDYSAVTASLGITSLMTASPAYAGTLTSAAFELGTTCELRQAMGACTTFRNCTTGNSVLRYSAGDLTFDTHGSGTSSIAPLADKSYPTLRMDGATILAGSAVTMSSTGADIPAFSADLAAPAQATITSYFDMTNLIDRSKDLVVTWTGGTGVVDVSMSGGIDDVSGFDCHFDASAGHAAIPSDAMSAATLQGTLNFLSLTTTTQTVGPWSVTANLAFQAVWSDGRAAKASIGFMN